MKRTGKYAIEVNMKRKNFSQAGTVLSRLLRNYGLERKIAEYQFVNRWSEIVGAEAASRTKPEGIQGTTLWVRVRDSTWAQELSFAKESILDKFEEVVGTRMGIKDIHFYVGGGRRG